MRHIEIGSGIYIKIETKEKVDELYGHGCVICGHPICRMDTDALRPDTNTAPEKFVLLCQKHFLEKKNGRIAAADLAAAIRNPYNINRNNGHGGNTDIPFKFGPSAIIEIHLGPFVMLWDEDPDYNYTCVMPLVVDGTTPLELMKVGDHLTFGVTLLDEYNNAILQIRDNIIQACHDFIDIIYANDKITVKRKQEEVLYELVYQYPNKVYFKKANLLINGVEIRVLNGKVVVNNKELEADGAIETGNLTLISIGENGNLSNLSLVNIKNLNRYAR